MSSELQHLRAYLEYVRDLGLYDFYRQGPPAPESEFAKLVAAPRAAGTPRVVRPRPEPGRQAISVASASSVGRAGVPEDSTKGPARSAPPPRPVMPSPSLPAPDRQVLETPIGRLIPLDEVIPVRGAMVPSADRPAALAAVRADIGDCTRCPLAYAGRHTIVYGEGDPNAKLMFVGEGPGADEDASGRPFVGKAGQLLNNMIAAMGLQREQVYIANIVKCRPPGNRVPEPAEANTCVPFLAQQIDIVGPQVVVALGLTAAMYLLGARQSLGSLRGRWHQVRGAKVAVTYHPAFLLRDPRQKGEAWKDLQRVMTELKLKPLPSSATSNGG